MTAASVPAVEPRSLRIIASRVDDRLTDLLAEERRRWSVVDPDLASPVDTLSAMVLGGGKRLRPAFCHWGFVAAGGDPDDPRTVDAGAAFELLQAFALIHDDVMDGSATRRGARTTHLQYADLHDGQRWLGEDRRFGEGVAILIGNMAHVLADRLIREAAGRPLAVWDELRLELNMGQYLDMVGTARRDTRIDRAHLVARYKSGKYTVERPLHIGADLADRYDELGPVLSEYGDPVGEAFQLRDDLLDVFGDAELIGKPIGGDLREGKPTALLAATVQRSAGNGQRQLLDRIGDPTLGPADVAAIAELMESCGAKAAIERAIDELTERAVGAIAHAAIDPSAIDELTTMATYLAARER